MVLLLTPTPLKFLTLQKVHWALQPRLDNIVDIFLSLGSKEKKPPIFPTVATSPESIFL